MLRHQASLRRRLQVLRGHLQAGRWVEGELESLEADVGRSAALAARRRAGLPSPRLAEDLPVSQHRDAIAEAIMTHQVTVVCGETGSGKTTQIPKICLSLGRGVQGLIGHTQPRRLAARSVAARIANELDSELGHWVGYKVRFSDRVSPNAYVKLMTDGILLAETQSDRWLDAYDTLILDEAHERSLNIDFLLGYLKRLLPRRPELKLIITSATIDPASFSRHFGNAPVVEVPGRTYPVEVRYRPLVAVADDVRDRDMTGAILEAVDEVSGLGRGDVLVFLSGEREIRETAEALRKHHPGGSEVLPLYARLSAADQERIFQPASGRRIVLATNVAETSLTVPGIRYVVDPGYARISRYSYRSKVQRLPVEPVSQASANQRKGRCGRVSAGVCLRLYSEEDFQQRPLYTEPEIQRTNLAAVILQMAVLGLGEVEDFPFMDPPDRRYVKDGYRLLTELEALDGRQRLTPLGRKLARLPLDPRLGRMVLAAAEEGCLSELLVIVSALSVQDPRERPADARQKADEAQRRFQDERSDFLGFLRLWSFYHDNARHLSRSKLRRLCRECFLSYVRMREWHDIHQQILAIAHDMGLRANAEPADYAAIHRALLSALLGKLGFRDTDEDYTGARNIHFRIFPGSALARKRPKWVVAAELVETTRLYARVVAKVEPAWVEPLAGHLLRRSYTEPRWDPRRARVVATEKVSLYGLPIVPGRRVNYGPIDPALARKIFIGGALVEGAYRSEAAWLRHNRALEAELRDLEHRSRRHDLLVNGETRYAFYDQRIPAGIYDGPRFERWRRAAEKQDPRILFFRREDLMRRDLEHVSPERFPDCLEVRGVRLELEYRFDPNDERDGVTVRLPISILNTLSPRDFEWLVPGLLRDKLIQLVKGLPKSMRRNFVPVPDFVDACLEALRPREGPLPEALGRHLTRLTGVPIPAQDWQPEHLPAYLQMRFALLDEHGEVLEASRDLVALQRVHGQQARETFRPADGAGLERDGVTRWDFGALPETVSFQRDGVSLTAYPALVDQGESVAIRLLDVEGQAAEAHRKGLTRLFMLALPQQFRSLEKHLPGLREMCLEYATLTAPGAAPSQRASASCCQELKRHILELAAERAFLGDYARIRSAAVFEERRERGRARLVDDAAALCRLVGGILKAHGGLRRRLSSARSGPGDALDDIRLQLRHLVHRGFVADTPLRWLTQLPRYLQAVGLRLDRLVADPARDAQRMAEIAPYCRAYLDRVAHPAGAPARTAGLDEFRWTLEEFRVSLFAQELRTLFPVSAKRLDRRLQELDAEG
jgi:ATP-dependent helicase HrpA